MSLIPELVQPVQRKLREETNTASEDINDDVVVTYNSTLMNASEDEEIVVASEPMIDMRLSLQKLKELCNERKLSTLGKKSDLVKRLNS